MVDKIHPHPQKRRLMALDYEKTHDVVCVRISVANLEPIGEKHPLIQKTPKHFVT